MSTREILKLCRNDKGDFEIYADGKLVETIPDANIFPALLPVKLWRHFNNIIAKRITKC